MTELHDRDEVLDDPENGRIKDVKEVTENDRLEEAAEEISRMEQLRPEVWSASDEVQREAYLRQVGRRLSAAYECPAPPFIDSQMPEVDGGVLLGAYSDPEYLTRLNRELLQAKGADEALGIYCHEFRHAYQHEMAIRYNSAFRHLCHDEAAAARWAENLNGGYITFGDDPRGYEAQDVERDAREFADKMTKEIQRRRVWSHA